MVSTLSIAMIVKNEAAILGRVLADASAFCDEMVVVDTGSTDDTVEIAKAAGAVVSHFDWVDNFAAARNASFAACTCDWIMWLDADDRIPAALQPVLKQLKQELTTATDAVYMPYRYHFADGGEVCTWSFPRERILRRLSKPVWEGAVHEVITTDGSRSMWRDDVWIEHRPLPEAGKKKEGRNLVILEREVKSGDRSLRTLFYYGNELSANGRDQEALATWSEFVSAAPTGWERYSALTSMAEAQQRLGEPGDSEATLHRALREDPTRAEAYVLLGLLHYHAERWSAAVPYFLAATGCRKPTEGFISARDYAYRPWDFMSVCYQRMGDQPKALEALGHAMDGNPDRDRLIDNAGWILKTW